MGAIAAEMKNLLCRENRLWQRKAAGVLKRQTQRKKRRKIAKTVVSHRPRLRKRRRRGETLRLLICSDKNAKKGRREVSQKRSLKRKKMRSLRAKSKRSVRLRRKLEKRRKRQKRKRKEKNLTRNAKTRKRPRESS